MNEQGVDADGIVMSGEVGIEAAIGALKRDACDYLRNPTALNGLEELMNAVSNALERRRLASVNRAIGQKLENAGRMHCYLSTARRTSSIP